MSAPSALDGACASKNGLSIRNVSGGRSVCCAMGRSGSGDTWPPVQKAYPVYPITVIPAKIQGSNLAHRFSDPPSHGNSYAEQAVRLASRTPH